MIESNTSPQAVLCIPGPWPTRQSLVEQLESRADGYLVAGPMLFHALSGEAYLLEWEAHDPRMAPAFRAAGAHWAASAEMARIDEHTSVAYLIGQVASRAEAQGMMLAADALLAAGGLGVKIEGLGLAHAPNAWRAHCAEREGFGAYRAWVLIVAGAQVRSCGMQHVGLRDAIVDAHDAADAIALLRGFSEYSFAESPALRVGQTFAAAPGAPVYRLSEASQGGDAPNEDQNPFGYWRLTPA